MARGLQLKLPQIVLDGLQGPQRGQMLNQDSFLKSLDAETQKNLLLDIIKRAEKNLPTLLTLMKTISSDFDELNLKKIAMGRTETFYWNEKFIVPILSKLSQKKEFIHIYRNAVIDLDLADTRSMKEGFKAAVSAKDIKISISEERQKETITLETLQKARKILAPLLAWDDEQGGRSGNAKISRNEFIDRINIHLKNSGVLVSHLRFEPHMFETIKFLRVNTLNLTESLAKEVMIVGEIIQEEIESKRRLDIQPHSPTP
jgi:hypothetical protein